MPPRLVDTVDCRGLVTDFIVLLLQFSFSTRLDEHILCIDTVEDDNLVVVVIALDCYKGFLFAMQ